MESEPRAINMDRCGSEGPSKVTSEIGTNYNCLQRYAWMTRRTVHKHRNLLAHAPDRLHDEMSAEYNDMTYAVTPREIDARRRSLLASGG